LQSAVCRTDDLRVAFSQYKMSAIEDAARMVEAETERVCELAEDLASLATNLRRSPALAAATGVDAPGRQRVGRHAARA